MTNCLYPEQVGQKMSFFIPMPQELWRLSLWVTWWTSLEVQLQTFFLRLHQHNSYILYCTFTIFKLQMQQCVLFVHGNWTSSRCLPIHFKWNLMIFDETKGKLKLHVKSPISGLLCATLIQYAACEVAKFCQACTLSLTGSFSKHFVPGKQLSHDSDSSPLATGWWLNKSTNNCIRMCLTADKDPDRCHIMAL